MNWSGEQQRLLAAMGYALYRRAGAPPALAEAPAVTAPGAVARVEAAGVVRAASPGEDRLWQALRRAAGGRDPEVPGLPPLAVLRTDPAAKRALWPRLRALRRG